MTLLEKLNRFPPFVCRLVARKLHGREALSEREIAERSGLSRKHVRTLSHARTWDNIPLATADRFAAGCGVNLAIPWRHVEWLKRRKKIAWRGKEAMVSKLLKVK